MDDNAEKNESRVQEHSVARDGYGTTVNTRPQVGQTRDCTDPWNQPFIQPGGQVWPCCWYIEDDVGNLKDKTFGEIWNDKPVKDLRRGLLTGQLNKHCINCPSRGLTTPDALLKKVRSLSPIDAKKVEVEETRVRASFMSMS